MKKLSVCAMCRFYILMAFSDNANAQNYEKPHDFTSKDLFVSSVHYLAAWQADAKKDIYKPTKKNINVRAYKDFQVRYNEADNVMWYYDPKAGFECYFLKDGYGDRVIYDKNGRWQYSLIMYGEENLPRDIRASIKSTYFDFDITLVEEIQMPGGIEYVVYLVDKSNIQILKVNSEGEIQILQELVRSKIGLEQVK